MCRLLFYCSTNKIPLSDILEDKEHSEEELPSYVEWEIAEDQIELEIDQEMILEELSETYGYLIESADFEIIIEVKDGEAQKS